MSEQATRRQRHKLEIMKKKRQAKEANIPQEPAMLSQSQYRAVAEHRVHGLAFVDWLPRQSKLRAMLVSLLDRDIQKRAATLEFVEKFHVDSMDRHTKFVEQALDRIAALPPREWTGEAWGALAYVACESFYDHRKRARDMLKAATRTTRGPFVAGIVALSLLAILVASFVQAVANNVFIQFGFTNLATIPYVGMLIMFLMLCAFAMSDAYHRR